MIKGSITANSLRWGYPGSQAKVQALNNHINGTRDGTVMYIMRSCFTEEPFGVMIQWFEKQMCFDISYNYLVRRNVWILKHFNKLVIFWRQTVFLIQKYRSKTCVKREVERLLVMILFKERGGGDSILGWCLANIPTYSDRGWWEGNCSLQHPLVVNLAFRLFKAIREKIFGIQRTGLSSKVTSIRSERHQKAKNIIKQAVREKSYRFCKYS